MANIRPPVFGLKKDELSLTSQDPNAVMYGVTPDSKFIPIKVSDTGEIMLGGTITLEPGDLQIGAVEIKNHDTDDRVFVNTDHEMLVESRLHDGAGTDITSTGTALDINLKSGLVKDADDNSIAANQAGLQLGISLLYGYDGSSNWERIHQLNNRLLVDIIGTANIQDGAGNALTSTIVGSDRALDINIVAGANGLEVVDDGSIAGGQTTALSIVVNYGWNGATWERLSSSSNRLIVDGSGVTQPISASSLPLPVGASTSALQSAGNLSLSNINTSFDVVLSTRASESTLSSLNVKFNSLGQKLMAGSVPVVLSSDHSSIGVTVGNFPASQTVDQPTHDLLNLNANLQVGDLDISVTNPVPIHGTIVNAATGNPNPVVIGGRNADTNIVHSLTTETLFGHEHLNTITIGQRVEFVLNDTLFGFEDDVNLPVSGTEFPAYLLRNPVASGKTIYLGNISFGIDSDKKVSYKIRVSPTVTLDGTPISVFSQNVGGSATEVLDVFSGPTVSALGGSIRHYTSGKEAPSKDIDLDFGILIQAGEEVLITGIPSANNVVMSVSLEWSEV